MAQERCTGRGACGLGSNGCGDQAEFEGIIHVLFLDSVTMLPQQGENTHMERAQTTHKSDCVW